MNKYESVIILSANASEEAMAEWGKKTFAYEIKKEKEGFYTLFTFTAKPEFVAELDRVLRLDETVLKHMIVKLED